MDELGGFRPEWAHDGSLTQIQAAVLHANLSELAGCKFAAKNDGRPAIILCDRTPLDAKAFLSADEWRACLALVGVDDGFLASIFDIILFWEGTANLIAPDRRGSRELVRTLADVYRYGAEPGCTNRHRWENADEAVANEIALASIYQDCFPYGRVHAVRNPQPGPAAWTTKVAQAVSILLRRFGPVNHAASSATGHRRSPSAVLFAPGDLVQHRFGHGCGVVVDGATGDDGFVV